jgi:NADH-quinone oxidoreductase subunit F
MKWSFMPKPVFPKYLVCNCDESEPGTFSNREIVLKTPHTLLEGFMLGCYAIGCNHGYIYVRGEMMKGYYNLRRALAEAKGRGYVGKNVLGSGFDLEITIHTGAGAYICGEATRPCSPRWKATVANRALKPARYRLSRVCMPSRVGLQRRRHCRTFHYIVQRGIRAFKHSAPRKSPCMKIVSVIVTSKSRQLTKCRSARRSQSRRKYPAACGRASSSEGLFPGGSSLR